MISNLKITILKKDIDLLTQSEIEKIVFLSFKNNIPFSLNYDERASGRYILCEYEENGTNHVKYILYSRRITGTSKDGRNSYIIQSVTTVLHRYFKDSTDIKNKFIELYLFDTDKKAARNEYQQSNYRIIKTLGIKILNEKELGISITPYVSIQDWKLKRKDLEKSNNNSSYIMEESDNWLFFGKTFGANAKESVALACAMASISEKSIKLYPVMDNETDKFNLTDLELLKTYKIEVMPEIKEFNSSDKDFKTSRNQAKFKYKLLKKFGQPKCCLCGCSIEKAIIASHVHRVTDIDKSSISLEEKYKQAADGNNGLWLCANHDKFFEFGLITFDNSGNLIINEKLEKEEKYFIEHITITKKIDDKFITPEFLYYLNKHRERVEITV